MPIQKIVTILVTAAALTVGLALPPTAAAQIPLAPLSPYGQLVPTTAQPTVQTPEMNPCPGGPQPIITSHIEGGALIAPSFVNTGFLTPGFLNSGFPFAFAGSTLALDRVTEIRNFNGVEGLVLTIFSGGFSRPVLGLGVPDYIMQAYGGNIGAIQQDLVAGYLKCRSH